MRKRRSKVETPTPTPRFRANKMRVRYGGMRWRLLQDRGRWLLVERRGTVQWIPGGAAA